MGRLTELGELMHEEHFRILVLICGLENRLCGSAGLRPLDLNDTEDRALLDEMIQGLEEIAVHNAFEETVLFPALHEKDIKELTDLLAHEHEVIGPLAQRLRALVAMIVARGSCNSEWPEFRDTSMELVSQLMVHLQKEETAVVQRLRALLDSDVDHALAVRLLAARRHRVAKAKECRVADPTEEAA